MPPKVAADPRWKDFDWRPPGLTGKPRPANLEPERVAC